MKRNLWIGLILITVVGMAAADPHAKVRKVNDSENSYTYYNWKPNKPKPQMAPAVAAPVAAPAAAAPAPAPAAPAYTPVQPSPALMNPAMAPEYNPGYNAMPAQQVAPPAYYGPQSYGPQSYYSSPYFSSGYYNSGYSYPGLQVSNSGFYNGLSISGIYRNGNITVRAGFPSSYGPGFNSGFYGPGPGSGFYGPGSGFYGPGSSFYGPGSGFCAPGSGFCAPGSGFNGGGLHISGGFHGGGHHR
jgi:hypothetical protein